MASKDVQKGATIVNWLHPFLNNQAMKKIYFISGISLISLLISCSEDESQNDPNGQEEVVQVLLIGDWTATRLGVIYDDETEDSSGDPCGTFQRIRFSENGTWESDNFLLDIENEVCDFTGTWSGTYATIEVQEFPEANYEITIEQGDGQEDLVRYPEISFDGENSMRIQYIWSGPMGGNIAYSFVIYERD